MEVVGVPRWDVTYFDLRFCVSRGKRRRKIDAMALFWTVVLGFGVGRERSLTALRRAYERCTGTTLVPSAFYDRFTKPMAEFFRTVAAVLMERPMAKNKIAPLTPAVLHILLALSTRERHGYGIMKQAEADSQGKVKMGPGTLYGSLGRMIEGRTHTRERQENRPRHG
jgi:hypothetical protein